MSLPIINETISATDPTAVSGFVRLYAQSGGGGVAYTNAGTPITIGDLTRISFNASGQLKADDGTTALTLNPNSGSSSDAIATPVGTVWEYQLKYPGTRTPVVRYLTVPDAAGPYNVSAILTTQPASLPPAGLEAATMAGDVTGTIGNSVISAGAVDYTKLGLNPTCFFYRTTNYDIPNETWTNVPFQNFDLDNLDFYDGSHADRQYLTSEGLYNATYDVAWAHNSIGIRRCRFVQRGNGFDFPISYGGDLIACIMPTDHYQYQQVTGEPGALTDFTGYLYLQVWQNSGSTVQLVAQGIDAPIAMITYLGPTV